MPINSSIYHDLKLIPQPDGQTCWAASVAMIKGTTPQAVIARTPDELIAKGFLYWLLNVPQGGKQNDSGKEDWLTGRQKFAQSHGLRFSPPRSWTSDAFHQQLSKGPMMVEMLWKGSDYAKGSGSSGHAIVVNGLRMGSSGPEITVLDPWPPKQGTRRTIDLNRFLAGNYLVKQNQPAATTYGVYW